MNVLLSIKPKYANQILNGNKRYEFRKSVFNHRDLEMVYIYSSSPIKRIVGAFDPINPKDHIRNFVPPQSFCYTDKQWEGNLPGLHQEDGGDE